MQRRFKDTGLRNFVPCPPPHVSIAVTISIPRPKRLTQLLTPRSWLSLRGAGREPSAGDSEEALSCRVCMVEVGMPAGMELCVCVYIYVCVHVCTHVCMFFVCMYVCMQNSYMPSLFGSCQSRLRFSPVFGLLPAFLHSRVVCAQSHRLVHQNQL